MTPTPESTEEVIARLRGLMEKATLPIGQVGMWCEEGTRHNGRCDYSICANDQGPVESGDLYDGFDETGHICIASAHGKTEISARERATFLSATVNALPRLLADLERARKALRPFAAAAKDADDRGGVDDGTCPDDEPINDASDEVVTLGHCREARATLAAPGEKTT